MSTTANHKSQHVEGEFNIPDPSSNASGARGTYVHIVGNGINGSNLSNAHTLDWSGNAWFAGEVYVGGTSQTEGKQLATTEHVTNLSEKIGTGLCNGDTNGITAYPQ